MLEFSATVTGTNAHTIRPVKLAIGRADRDQLVLKLARLGDLHPPG